MQQNRMQAGRLVQAGVRTSDLQRVRRLRSSPPKPMANATVAIIAALAFALVACGTGGSVPSPTPIPSGSIHSLEPSPSHTASVSPSGTPSPSEAPIVRPTPVPPSWTDLNWSDPITPFPYQPAADAGPFGTTVTINDIAQWNGGYVGVGTIDRGLPCAEAGFFRSADGLHWDVAFTAPSGDDRTPTMCPQFVARVGNDLVALGQERIWRSEDGIAWTEVDSTSLRSLWGPSGAEELVAVTAGPSGIVVIGRPANTFESIVAFSPNGREWTPISLPARDMAIVWDATAYGHGFVIVGRDGRPDESYANVRPGVGSPAAWFSADGLTWSETKVAPTAVKGGVLTRVLPAAGGLFAIGNDVAVTASYEEIDAVGAWTSIDGRSWQKVGTLQSLVPQAAMLGSNGTDLVALQNGTTMWISTDGRGWRPVSITGSLRAPEYLLLPLSVHEASTSSVYDTRMWVTERGLILGYTAESPEGFAVIQMQLGTAIAP